MEVMSSSVEGGPHLEKVECQCVVVPQLYNNCCACSKITVVLALK